MRDRSLCQAPADGAGGAPAQIRPVMTQAALDRVGRSMAAARLLLATRGGLTPYVPFVDDGSELVICDRAADRFARLQVKTRSPGDVTQAGTVPFDVTTGTRGVGPGALFLGLLLGAEEHIIDLAWLIPIAALDAPREGAPMLRVAPGIDGAETDAYGAYRCATMARAAQVIEAHLRAG